MLGILQCAAMVLCSRQLSDRGGPWFMLSAAVAGVLYLLAVRELFAAPALARNMLVFGLVLAGVWHSAFLPLPPGQDDDIHRYVWDGRLQRLGYNPYLIIPSDPAVQGLHTAETRNLNNPDLASPYPPVAELFFRAVTAVGESTRALKIAFALCEFAIVFVLLDLLRISGQREHLVLVYAWNPLLAIEVSGSGHIDILGALLLVISVAALARHWRTVAALTFGLAVAVKFLPLVLLPLYWKRVRIRDAMLTITVLTLLYVPFLNHGRLPTGSLGTFVQTFRFNGPIFAILNRIAPPKTLAALAVLAGLATSLWLRRIGIRAPDAFSWPMAVSLMCGPVVFPWYLLWLLPFLTSASTLLMILWTVCVVPTYVQWHLRALGHPWGPLPVWVMIAEYGCLSAAALVIFLRRRNRKVAGGTAKDSPASPA